MTRKRNATNKINWVTKEKSKQIAPCIKKYERVMSGDRDSAIIDILVDLMHFCLDKDVHFPTVLDIAYGHFEVERKQ